MVRLTQTLPASAVGCGFTQSERKELNCQRSEAHYIIANVKENHYRTNATLHKIINGWFPE